MAARCAQPEERREMSVEIDAEPLSSEDEQVREKTPEDTPRSKRMLEVMKRDEEKMLEGQRRRQSQVKSTTGAKAKNGKTAQPRRSQRKLQDDPVELTLASGIENHHDDEGDVSDDGAAIMSWKQPSPKKRRIGTYRGAGAGAVNIHTSAPLHNDETRLQAAPVSSLPSQSGQSNRPSFRVPDGFKVPSPVSQKTAGFAISTGHTPPTRRSTRTKIKDEDKSFKFPDEILSPKSVTVKKATFKLSSESATSSATTTRSDPASAVFSHSESPILGRFQSRSRSGSASSLSSVNSIASFLLTQEEKDQLMTDDKADDPTHHERRSAQCPFCSSPVRSIHLEEFTIRYCKAGGRLLPSRLQQRFCHEHRAEEASQIWTQRGYPTINWTELATTRVEGHLPAIEAILRTNDPASYYHAKLVEATTTTGGSSRTSRAGRSTLLKYLKEDILDVVKYGYYGPRGAKIAAEAITSSLSAALAEAALRDRLVRECGAGAFVQAVLVPELLGRWVAEDRRRQRPEHELQPPLLQSQDEDEEDEEDVRRILEESSEIGALLNEDEDVLVSRADDGEKGRG